MSDSRLLQNFAWFGLFYDALQKESCLRSVNLFSNCNVSNLSVKLVSYAYIFLFKKGNNGYNDSRDTYNSNNTYANNDDNNNRVVVKINSAECFRCYFKIH